MYKEQKHKGGFVKTSDDAVKGEAQFLSCPPTTLRGVRRREDEQRRDLCTMLFKYMTV